MLKIEKDDMSKKLETFMEEAWKEARNEEWEEKRKFVKLGIDTVGVLSQSSCK